MELIKNDHFSGGANITPTPDASKPDLADIIREIQVDVNAVVGEYVSITSADSPLEVSDERLIGVDTTTAVVSVNLPAASAVRAGTSITVKDEGGNCTTNPATINADGDDLIDGAASVQISADSAYVKMYSNGADAWFLIHG